MSFKLDSVSLSSLSELPAPLFVLYPGLSSSRAVMHGNFARVLLIYAALKTTTAQLYLRYFVFGPDILLLFVLEFECYWL
jgi:hypothetical protein